MATIKRKPTAGAVQEGYGGGRADFVPGMEPRAIKEKTKLEQLMDNKEEVLAKLERESIGAFDREWHGRAFDIFARQIRVHDLDMVDLEEGLKVTYMLEKGEAPGQMDGNLKAVGQFLANMQMPGIGMREIQKDAYPAPDGNEKSLDLKLYLIRGYLGKPENSK